METRLCMEQGTLQALRAVKDYLVPNASAENFDMTTGHTTKCKNGTENGTDKTDNGTYKIQAAKKEELEKKDKLAEVERVL